MWMTSIGATCIILFVYLVVSCILLIIFILIFIVSGYLKFGIHTEGNILNSYPQDSVFPTVARLGLGFGIICHFPIAYFAVRTNLHSLCCSLKEFHSFKLRLMYISILFLISSLELLFLSCLVLLLLLLFVLKLKLFLVLMVLSLVHWLCLLYLVWCI